MKVRKCAVKFDAGYCFVGLSWYSVVKRKDSSDGKTYWIVCYLCIVPCIVIHFELDNFS